MALACFITPTMLSQEPRVNVLLPVAGQVGYGVKDVKEKGLYRKEHRSFILHNVSRLLHHNKQRAKVMQRFVLLDSVLFLSLTVHSWPLPGVNVGEVLLRPLTKRERK